MKLNPGVCSQCETSEQHLEHTKRVLRQRMRWRDALNRVVDGRCPWCGHRIVSIEVSPEFGVRWSCLDGCNHDRPMEK